MMEGYQFPKQLDEALGARDDFEFRWAPKFFLGVICPFSYFADSLHSICCLINLQHLHEASILHVLNERYNEGLIYTATGPIIIALNPFKRMSLYTKEILNKYIIYGNVKNDQAASAAGQALSPHVYGVAANAYRSMCQNMGSNGNQSVLISGESGAGKTVSTKYVMQYLATAGNMADNTLIKNKSGDKAKRKTLKAQEVNAATKVAQQILQSNPFFPS